LWLWPNLLSLDAPLVAVLWQLLFARCFHIAIDATATALLVLAVWLIYAADRMLDALAHRGQLPRHEFYRRHWKAVLPVWTGALLFAAWLAWTRLPSELFNRGVLIACTVALYFAVVHLIRPAWPKELAVGILFALGASVAAWSAVRSAADVEAIVLFSCLCWINCIAIERWERREMRWPVGILAMAVAGAATLTYLSRPVLSAAEILSALAFVILDRRSGRISADALRVLADVALLTPVFFLPIAGMLH
jgi:hypothetical protein